MRFYEEIPEADLAQDLRSLGRHARKLLEECVEAQEVRRSKASKAAETLFDAGFLFIREAPDFFDAHVILRPSLLGEEALECLEKIDNPQNLPMR